MKKSSTFKISGEKLSSVFEGSLHSVESFADKMKYSVRRVSVLMAPGVHGVYKDRFWIMAEGFGMKPEELLEKIGATADEIAADADRKNSPFQKRTSGKKIHDALVRAIKVLSGTNLAEFGPEAAIVFNELLRIMDAIRATLPPAMRMADDAPAETPKPKPPRQPRNERRNAAKDKPDPPT